METYKRIRELKKLNTKLLTILKKIKVFRDEIIYLRECIEWYKYHVPCLLRGHEKEIQKNQRKINKLLESYSLLNKERKQFRVITKSTQCNLF